MIRNILLALVVLLIVVLQVSVISQYVILKNYFNIFILFIIFLLLSNNFRFYVIYTLVMGLVADVYSGLGFGILTLSLLTCALIAYILYINFFSHRAGLTLIVLIGIMSATYLLSIGFYSFIFYALNVNQYVVYINNGFIFKLLGQIIINSIVFMALYIIFGGVVRRLRERFIISKT